MSDIRYISLSDLHLGAENSLLTRLTSVSNDATHLKADPTTASDVMAQLAKCLRLLMVIDFAKSWSAKTHSHLERRCS